MYCSKHIRELFVLVLVIESSLCDMNEPRCYSRFDYEKKMLEKMVRTEVKMEELLGKLEALEKRLENVKTEADTLVEDIHAQEKRLTDVETVVANSTKEIQSLKKKHDTEIELSVKGIRNLEERYDSLQTESEKFENLTKSHFDGYEKSLEIYDQRLDAMSRNISESMHHSPVAFFVYLTSYFISSSSHQTLLFNNVVTDVSGDYNPGTGVFTAPVDGLYVFSTSVTVDLSTSTKYANFQINKNGTVVAFLIVQDSNGNYETVSGTIILSLQVGDTVDVTCNEIGRNIHGGHYTFLSGFRLLSANECTQDIKVNELIIIYFLNTFKSFQH